MTAPIAYYNEHDRHAAQWLRNLIDAGHITPGVVDERDIQEVQPSDLTGHTHVHLFAGIGGWAHALRLARWPDDRPVWTGSCPCQPFSCAGKGAGEKDARHLWPHMCRLIGLHKPPVVFGEQVASAAGRAWLAGVRADLEGLGYAVGAADLCAASAGAPHIRQRLFWVADSAPRRFGIDGGPPWIGGHADKRGPALGLADPGELGRRPRRGEQGHEGRERFGRDQPVHGGEPERLAHSEHARGWPALPGRGPQGRDAGDGDGAGLHGPGRLGSPNRPGREELRGPVAVGAELMAPQCPGGLDNWYLFDLVSCRDGKARRIEPGSFPLAHGVPGRVGLLRGYGNAIVPQIAASFIRAYLNTEEQ